MRVFATILVLAGCAVDDGSDPTPGERLCTTGYIIDGTYTLGATLPPDRTIQLPDEPPDADPKLDGTPGADGIPDIQGCWPVGTWRFRITPTDGTCVPPAEPPGEIAFVVDRVDNGPNVEPTFTYELTAPSRYRACGVGSTGDCAIVRVTEGGAGKCEGAVELFGPGGEDVFFLQPVLGEAYRPTSPLTGSGELGHFEDQQLPEGDPPPAGCAATGGASGATALALLLIRRRRRSR